MSDDDLIDAAELGEEAKKFIASDLGQTLLARAQQETLAALEELSNCDPSDSRTVKSLQDKAALGRKFPEWLNEIVGIGNEALTVWRQQNEA